jgi:phospholipid transport system substrate-binding protein
MQKIGEKTDMVIGQGIGRRGLLKRMKQAAIIAVFAGLAPSLSHALSEDEASDHVRLTINEVSALIDGSGDKTAKARGLLEIMETRAAMPQIARFAAGHSWRGMSDDQQSRFVSAFGPFLSTIYAGRFTEYAGGESSGEPFKMGRVVDAGRKGMLVKTTIQQAGEASVDVEWLVTDRPGRVVIADIVIEGISMLVTEREEIGGMLEARGGDVDKLIADLAL